MLLLAASARRRRASARRGRCRTRSRANADHAGARQRMDRIRARHFAADARQQCGETRQLLARVSWRLRPPTGRCVETLWIATFGSVAIALICSRAPRLRGFPCAPCRCRSCNSTCTDAPAACAAERQRFFGTRDRRDEAMLDDLGAFRRQRRPHDQDRVRDHRPRFERFLQVRDAEELRLIARAPARPRARPWP